MGTAEVQQVAPVSRFESGPYPTNAVADSPDLPDPTGVNKRKGS